MRRFLILAAVLAVLAGVLVVSAVGVSAQNVDPVPKDPVVCDLEKWDMNDDGRLNKGDVDEWAQRSARCVDPETGQALPGVQCEPELDIDGDGKVDLHDGELLYYYIIHCMRWTWEAPLPPRP
jgi:hypothetical protein